MDVTAMGLGLGPGRQRPITTARLQATGLALLAVVLAQLGRPAGELAPLLVAFAFTAGAAVAFQSAFNGRITSSTGDPVAATAINVTVGTIALGAVLIALSLSAGLGPLHWPAQPWLYTGGLLGVTIVFSLAAATAALGVLSATLTVLAAQMVMAFVVDWTILRQAPTPGAVSGALLIITAVALVGRRPTPIAAPPAGEL